MNHWLKSFIKRKKKAVIAFSIVVVSLVSFSFVEDYYFEVSKNLDIFTTLFRDVNVYYVDTVQEPLRDSFAPQNLASTDTCHLSRCGAS